jgi:hypothetical protein
VTEQIPKAIIDHASRGHAKKSPSGFELLMACPGSVMYTRYLLEYGDPYAADLGTFGHEISEECFKSSDQIDWIVEEMLSEDNRPDWLKPADDDILRVFPKAYVEYNEMLGRRLKPFRTVTELKVRLFKDCWGTMDRGYLYNIKDGVAMATVDYKQGVTSKQAKGNPQIAIYLAAWAKMLRKEGIEIVKYTGVIFQPRCPGEPEVRKVSYTPEEMGEWVRKIKKYSRRADKIFDGRKKLRFKVGKHCDECFCRGRVKCKAYQNAKDTEGLLVPDNLPDVLAPHSMTDEQLVAIHRNADKIKGILKSVAAYLLARAAAKDAVPGTKPVEGRTQRAWNGKQADVAVTLRDLGVTEPIETKSKLVGIGKAENEIMKSLDPEVFKTVKARKAEAGRLLQIVTKRTEGKLSIALEEDSRPEVGVTDGRLQASEDLLGDLE